MACAAIGLPAQPLTWATTLVALDAPPLAETVEADYTFTNTSGRSVTIEEVHSSCGCTVPTLPQRTYAPGESGTIRAVFTLGERVGLQEKVITVTTAEPDPSRTSLLFRVQIPKLYEVAPHFLIWNAGEAPAEKTIRLRLLAPDVLGPPRVDSRHANFAATVKPSDEQPGLYSVAITPQSTATPVNGTVLVAFDTSPGQPHTLTLYALVRQAPAPRAQAP